MEITLIKGTNKYLVNCVDALVNSKLGEEYFPKKENAENAIKEFVKNKTLLIAVNLNKEFIGFICYINDGAFHSFPYLHIIAVSKIFRGNGCGSLMMDAFERMMFERQDKIFLVVADFNDQAKDFYKNRGYVEIGPIPNLYRKGINENMMMKIRL